jgi:hypothetical protein
MKLGLVDAICSRESYINNFIVNNHTFETIYVSHTNIVNQWSFDKFVKLSEYRYLLYIHFNYLHLVLLASHLRAQNLKK